jgi:hypothetical protein
MALRDIISSVYFEKKRFGISISNIKPIVIEFLDYEF